MLRFGTIPALFFRITRFSALSGMATGSSNGHHRKNNFLEVMHSATLRTLILVGALGTIGTGASQAAITFVLTESGGNVNFNMSGSIDTTALGTDFGSFPYSSFGWAFPSTGRIGVGNGPTEWFGCSAPDGTSFGTGAYFDLTGTSGDVVILPGGATLVLPVGYVSGAPLSGSGWEAGATFASLGITPGAYTTNFSNGSHSDHVTVAVVPEVQGSLLAVAGLGTLLLRRKRRATPV